MPSISHSIQIDAPKQAVWDILADIGGVATWAPNVNHAVRTNDIEPGVGCANAHAT
jgi:carbon monoxide dehydrogenase subunit G